MEFIDDKIQMYANMHTSDENNLLKVISKETLIEVAMPRMISGHYQGRVLSMFSAMICPKNILEIGTYTGYSALCMAEHLQKNGKLITIDSNALLKTKVKNYFAQSPYNQQIEYIIGNAIDILPTLEFIEFDLVFIDADKINNETYYDLVFDKVKKGGFILIDNVLWSGKVVDDKIKIDKKTEAILKFNTKIQNDKRVENVLLAIRDGIMIVRKL